MREPAIVTLHDGKYLVTYPNFVHEYGDAFHHWSMVRTCIKDEDGTPISGGPNELQIWLHELLDDVIFYPIQHWLSKWIGDNRVYTVLKTILGIGWGFNCGFPARDIALYTVWYLRGCKVTWTKLPS
jgi:hypothetical protein